MIRTAVTHKLLAAAFSNRLAVAGVTPNSTQREAVQALALALDGIGLAKFFAVYPILGGTAATHALDMMGRYPVTWAGGLTHDANGVTGNGSTGWGNTGFVPSGGQWTLSDAHLSCYMAGSPGTGTTRTMIGGSTTLSTNWSQIIWGNSGSQTFTQLGATGTGQYSPAAGRAQNTGFLSVTVDGSRVQNCYMDGTLQGPAVTGSGGHSANPVALLAHNQGTSRVAFSNQTMRFATIGGGLDATEAGLLAAAVHAFQTALGRAV